MAASPWEQQVEGEAGGGSGRELMFEKVVTPSDVGKLNRLVVPKHYAEKYFPLGAAARGNPAGTVLCFHDGDGDGATTWRFRYSYWSSSQSYVITKGWSRFVRDKRLAAGDTVSFCRAGARLFIDCRSRAAASTQVQPAPSLSRVHHRPLPLPPSVVVDEVAASGRRCLRLFGVDLQLRAEPPPPDLHL